MQTIVLAISSLLAFFAASDAYVIPAGKCREDIVPIPIDFQAFVSNPDWTVQFATDTDILHVTDHEIRKIKRNGKGYTVEDTVVGDDELEKVYSYNVTYIKGVVIEDTIDEKGNYVKYMDFPLAVTNNLEILYYRCSPSGKGKMDTRYIKALSGATISQEILDWFFREDAKHNFKGKWRKMPNRKVKKNKN